MSKKSKNSNLIAECVADAKAVASLTKAMRDSSVDNASLFLDSVFKDNAVLKESFTGGMSAVLAQKLKEETEDKDAEGNDDALATTGDNATDAATEPTGETGGEVDVDVDVNEPAAGATGDAADTNIFVQAVDQNGDKVSVNGQTPAEQEEAAAQANVEFPTTQAADQTDDTTDVADATDVANVDGAEIPDDDADASAEVDVTNTDAAPAGDTDVEEEDEATINLEELNEILKELADETEEEPTDSTLDGVEDVDADVNTTAPADDTENPEDIDVTVQSDSNNLATKDDVADLLKQAMNDTDSVNEVEDEINLESILKEIDSQIEESKKPECDDEKCDKDCKEEDKPDKEDLSEALRISYEENQSLKKTVSEYKKALDIVKTSLNEASKQLNETTLLNHKLLYTNKLFKDKSLTESQRVKIIEAFDRAHTKREVMITYAIMAENLINSKPIAKQKPMNNTIDSITEGLASKAIGSTKPSSQMLTESANTRTSNVDVTVDWLQRMAGIKSSY